MSSNYADIQQVSDTALMTAACRAIETSRPDGLVRDPFAEQLAGERGMAIAQGLARKEIMCFGVGIRSRFLDELVTEAISVRKVATVLSLGAGLDTRPWRLDLSDDLRWIEVDFARVLDYKAAILARHKPKCRLERMAADLNDPSARSSIFAAPGSPSALMITEGLLMYLPADTVEALAVEATGTDAIQYWLLDVASAEFERRIRMDAFDSIQTVRASDHLNGEQLLETMHRNGWASVRCRSYTVDALQVALDRIRALARLRPASEPAPPPPPPPNDPSGVHLYGRA